MSVYAIQFYLHIKKKSLNSINYYGNYKQFGDFIQQKWRGNGGISSCFNDQKYPEIFGTKLAVTFDLLALEQK